MEDRRFGDRAPLSTQVYSGRSQLSQQQNNKQTGGPRHQGFSWGGGGGGEPWNFP